MATRPVFGRLVLVRRGPLDARFDTMALGQEDPPLADGAHELETALVRRLRALGPVRVVASDLLRSRVTAERLAEEAGAALAVRRDLRPQRLGAWQGRAWSEIIASEPGAATAFLGDFVSAQPPRGETLEKLQARVRPAMLAEVRRAPRELTVAVLHAAPIRAIAASLLGLELAQVQRFALDPFGITTILLEGHHATLAGWNERDAETTGRA